MKRYIVTEEQLDRLERDAMVLGKYDGEDYSMSKSIFDRSAKQCRAIEVPDDAVGFIAKRSVGHEIYYFEDMVES